jgi:hypothetical protein
VDVLQYKHALQRTHAEVSIAFTETNEAMIPEISRTEVKVTAYPALAGKADEVCTVRYLPIQGSAGYLGPHQQARRNQETGIPTVPRLTAGRAVPQQLLTRASCGGAVPPASSYSTAQHTDGEQPAQNLAGAL